MIIAGSESKFPLRCAAALVGILVGCGLLSAQTAFQVGPLQVPPGQVRSGYLQVPPGKDGSQRIPVSVIHGSAPGPVLALIAGNHGYEYPPVLASQRLLTKINPAGLKGKVIIVHVANMPSFMKRTIYYSPVDWENLNRVYPGKADGTMSQRIAHVITTEVIDRADYLVDMHCGDGNESLRPYSYWMPIGEPRVDEPARQMVLAFGIPHIVIDPSRPKDAGASLYCSNTGMTRGKPSITIESGDMGIADNEEDIARIESGVMNLMKHLRMLDGQARMPAQVTWYEPSEVLRFPENLPEKEGLFFPQAQKGQMVEKGALLGYVADFFGKKIFDLRAPFAGEVLYIIGTPPISAGEPLAMVGAIKK
ncbi:MAG: M14 family metallopeptidase [Acidobacteriota bacterium]